MKIERALMIVAACAAEEVGIYLRRVFRQAVVVFSKRDWHDPVTVHDRYVETHLHFLLGSWVPNSRVLGEEKGEQILTADYVCSSQLQSVSDIMKELNGGSIPKDTDLNLLAELDSFDWKIPDHWGRAQIQFADHLADAIAMVKALGDRVRWVIDPIDGTSNFASGIEYFNTSIGVELDEKIVAGVVNVPFNRELYCADSENAEYWRDGCCTMLKADGPTQEQSAVLTGYLPLRQRDPEISHRIWQRARKVAMTYATVHAPGSAALDLAHVAAGHSGVAVGTAMKPWDVAAGIHLVRMAGGKVYTWPNPKYPELPEHLLGMFAATGRSLYPGTVIEVLEEVYQQRLLARGMKDFR